MATQQQWRDIAYQRWLGSNGISTGTMVNHHALQEFHQKQKQRHYRPPPIPSNVPPRYAPTRTNQPDVPSYWSTIEVGSRHTEGSWLGDQLAEMFESLVELSTWLIAHVPPARAIVKIGTQLAESESRVKLTHACIFAALAAVRLYAVRGTPSATEEWVGNSVILAVAGAAGWFFPLFLGGAVVVAIHLTAIVAFFLAVFTVLAIVLRLFTYLTA